MLGFGWFACLFYIPDVICFHLLCERKKNVPVSASECLCIVFFLSAVGAPVKIVGG